MKTLEQVGLERDLHERQTREQEVEIRTSEYAWDLFVHGGLATRGKSGIVTAFDLAEQFTAHAKQRREEQEERHASQRKASGVG